MNESTFARIVATSADAIISEDLDGTITSWNPAAEDLFGYAASEAVGQPGLLIVPADKQVEERERLRRIAAGHGGGHETTTAVRKGGERIDISLTVSPLLSADGRVAGVSKIARAVSPSDRAERDAQHLAALLNSSDDAIVSTDLHGTILSWNPAAERLFGYRAAEVIGRPFQILVPPHLHEEGDRILNIVRRGEVVDHVQTESARRDGATVPVVLTATPIRSPSGEVVGTSRILRDATRMRRARHAAFRLAAIVDSSDDAIVSKDLNGIVMSWNAAAEAMFGYTASEIVGRSIRLLIPADRQQEEDVVLSRIRRGDRVEHYETIRVRKNGELIPVSLTVSPVRDEVGTIVGASKIARDISDRRRAEEERGRLLEIAREASRLKDEFLATLSHELRTPLNAIVGYVRMIQSGLLTGEKQVRALDTVSRNVTALTQIVEDILDVSRIISGKLRLELQPVDLSLAIDEALETVRPAADAKGVRLESFAEAHVMPVSGDPQRMRQILWNLLSNAVKFTGGGGRVQVRLERVTDHVVVTVADTGIGIGPEFLPYVFERFRQADAGIARVRGGLGLGLAITRHLVELQGGRISVESEGEGKGASFRVELPVTLAHAGKYPVLPDAPHAATTPARIGVPQLQGLRILAVDDDRDTLALVREILEATGATVTTADSAEQAIEAIARTRPDLLLVDLAMPHMTGFELVAHVRRSDDEATRAIPAAAFTAFARSEDQAKALRSGFQMHLAKPIDPGELMAAMAALAKRVKRNR